MGSSISSKKPTKTSRILVKMNLFVRFFEEINDPKNLFEINWPLGICTKQDRRYFHPKACNGQEIKGRKNSSKNYIEKNQKGHKPKGVRTKKSTSKKKHKPKRARTKMNTNQKGHEPKRAQTKNSTNYNPENLKENVGTIWKC